MKHFINKNRYLLLIIIVCCIELFAIFLLFNPKVGKHYKLYYIERKLKFWNHNIFNTYKSGVKLTHKTIKPYLSKDGWSYAEEKFRWTDGKIAKIYLPLKSISKKEAILKLIINSLGEQEIELFINNVFIKKYIVKGSNRIVVFRFNSKLLKENEVNSIMFKLPNATKPLNSKDKRDLSIALKTFIMRY